MLAAACGGSRMGVPPVPPTAAPQHALKIETPLAFDVGRLVGIPVRAGARTPASRRVEMTATDPYEVLLVCGNELRFDR
ncbi:MAG: hypothetical protein AAF721_23480, partial [Myxococcota bacterium]